MGIIEKNSDTYVNYKNLKKVVDYTTNGTSNMDTSKLIEYLSSITRNIEKYIDSFKFIEDECFKNENTKKIYSSLLKESENESIELENVFNLINLNNKVEIQKIQEDFE